MRYVVSFKGRLFYRRPVPSDVQAVIGLKVWKRALGASTLTREAEKERDALAVAHDNEIADSRALFDPSRPDAERMRALRSNQRRISYTRRSPVDLALARAILPDLHTLESGATRQKVVEAQRRLDALSDDERALVNQVGGVEGFVAAYRKARLTRASAGDKFDIEAREKRLVAHESVLLKLGFDVPRVDDPNNPRISLVPEQWFAARKQRILAQRRHCVAVNRFVELHGDLPVRSITRQHVKGYITHMESCPDQRRVPVKQRGTLIDPGPDVRRIAAPTVERHLISIKALLTFCVEQDWCTTNVADGLKAPKDGRKKASKRRPWTLDERRAVLAQAIKEDDENGDMPWIIRLAIYTGARLEELCQLARDNVREIEGITCIEIDDLSERNVKTGGSVRIVPLHPAIARGFLDWVRKGHGERVFISFRRDRDGCEPACNFGPLLGVIGAQI